jgi:hypothetical protein
MSADDYAKQKLFEALHALVGAGPIQERLTFAAVALLQLRAPQPSHIPPKIAGMFHAVVDDLTATPLSDSRGYTPRPLADDKAQEIARHILSMHVDLTGGL